MSPLLDTTDGSGYCPLISSLKRNSLHVTNSRLGSSECCTEEIVTPPQPQGCFVVSQLSPCPIDDSALRAYLRDSVVRLAVHTVLPVSVDRTWIGVAEAESDSTTHGEPSYSPGHASTCLK